VRCCHVPVASAAVAVVLGVLVAIAFGTGDFLGGRTTNKASVIGTLVVSLAASVVGAALLIAVTEATVTAHDVALGACAGAVNVIGLGLLYQGLARHAAGVVAPIAAVVGAVVPVTWGLLQGERPSVVAFTGVLLAISAGALIGRGASESEGQWGGGAAIATLAGVALGISFVLFAESSDDSGMWPVFAARSTAALLVWSLALGLLARDRPSRVPAGRMRAVAAAAGLLDVAATALLLLAVRRGLTVVVAPIAALAPGFTVLLAWALLGEKLARTQRIGIVAALAGLALVSVG
jgi:drug/metabolite transporter (DMT)-like permease